MRPPSCSLSSTDDAPALTINCPSLFVPTAPSLSTSTCLTAPRKKLTQKPGPPGSVSTNHSSTPTSSNPLDYCPSTRASTHLHSLRNLNSQTRNSLLPSFFQTKACRARCPPPHVQSASSVRKCRTRRTGERARILDALAAHQRCTDKCRD